MNHHGKQITSPLKPWGTNNCVVCSGQIRILVTMATYGSDRLIMEKWKLTIIAVSLEIFDLFSQIRLLSSSPRFI